MRKLTDEQRAQRRRDYYHAHRARIRELATKRYYENKDQHLRHRSDARRRARQAEMNRIRAMEAVPSVPTTLFDWRTVEVREKPPEVVCPLSEKMLDDMRYYWATKYDTSSSNRKWRTIIRMFDEAFHTKYAVPFTDNKGVRHMLVCKSWVEAKKVLRTLRRLGDL